MSTVLVVDDKELLRDSVGTTLQRAGFVVCTAPDGRAALESIAQRRPDAVVTDMKMPGMSGIELLERIREIDDELGVVLMTAYGTVETAVRAIKLGAFDYITKPFEGDELVVSVKRAIEHSKLVRENAVLRRSVEGPAPVDGGPRGLDRVIGESPAMRRVKEQILAVAESHGTVLICGESGAGKEVIAQAIHELSPRDGAPLLAVNCAALSESLLESELFGHEKGAFTGAERTRKGRFELADNGTLLLDEISEISTRVQAKLLRVLQERTLERVGSSVSIGVDVRVIATSNRDLPKSVGAGEFRQDLFFRLNVLPIHVPPLRDRTEDIPELAEHFLQAIAARDGRGAKRLGGGALDVLRAYAWPGNVRELQNICERAAVLCPHDEVTRELIEPWLIRPAQSHEMAGIAAGTEGATTTSPALAPSHPGAAAASIEPKPVAGDAPMPADAIRVGGRALEDIEREAILATLARFNGHRQKTATALGIGVRTLGLKLKKWKELNLVEQGV